MERVDVFRSRHRSDIQRAANFTVPQESGFLQRVYRTATIAGMVQQAATLFASLGRGTTRLADTMVDRGEGAAGAKEDGVQDHRSGWADEGFEELGFDERQCLLAI